MPVAEPKSHVMVDEYEEKVKVHLHVDGQHGFTDMTETLNVEACLHKPLPLEGSNKD